VADKLIYMAAAVGIAVAEKLGSELIPALVAKKNARGALHDDIKLLLPTVAKVRELLTNLQPEQQALLTSNIEVLQHALAEADTIVQGLLQQEQQAEAEANAETPEPGARGLGDRAAAIASAAKKKVVEAVELGSDLINGDPQAQHTQLVGLNEQLLHASLDLSLAISRIPPKSSTCVIS
jgi:hypothetical protein